jgi:ferredoxin
MPRQFPPQVDLVLLTARPTGSAAERAGDAARRCPSGALTVAED